MLQQNKRSPVLGFDADKNNDSAPIASPSNIGILGKFRASRQLLFAMVAGPGCRPLLQRYVCISRRSRRQYPAKVWVAECESIQFRPSRVKIGASQNNVYTADQYSWPNPKS
jgi:hypothetical protein